MDGIGQVLKAALDRSSERSPPLAQTLIATVVLGAVRELSGVIGCKVDVLCITAVVDGFTVVVDTPHRHGRRGRRVRP